MKLHALLRPLALTALVLPAAAHAQQVFVSEPLQLYAGPGPRYPVLLTLYPGVDIGVEGCLPGYQWCDVVLPDGLHGWVYGGGLAFPWMGQGLPMPQYGASMGIPLIGFIMGDYWGRYYRDRPWYGEHRYWHPQESRPYIPPMHQAPPPPRAMPAPAPWGGGWAQPYPRQERERERDRDRERERFTPPRQEPGRGFLPPQQPQQAQPQPERVAPPRQQQPAPQVQPPQTPPQPPQQRPPDFQPRPDREQNRGGGNGGGDFRERGNRPEGHRGERHD